MDSNLQRLIDLARQHTITPAEREAQVRSFAYGNTKIENASITKADKLTQAMTALRAERASDPVRS